VLETWAITAKVLIEPGAVHIMKVNNNGPTIDQDFDCMRRETSPNFLSKLSAQFAENFCSTALHNFTSAEFSEGWAECP